MTIDRERIGHIITDYRDGLLDSLDDAIDAIEQEIAGKTMSYGSTLMGSHFLALNDEQRAQFHDALRSQAPTDRSDD